MSDTMSGVAYLAFTVENPGPSTRDSSLFQQSYTLWFLRKLFEARVLDTSYCKYGSDYRKHTAFITNIPRLRLHRPCASTKKHPRSVQMLSSKEKNSIPEPLLHTLLAAFMEEGAVRGCRRFHVIDVFSGWESMRSACKNFKVGSEIYHEMMRRLQRLDCEDMAVWLRVCSCPISYAAVDMTSKSLERREKVRYITCNGGKRRLVTRSFETTQPEYEEDFMQHKDFLPSLIKQEYAKLKQLEQLDEHNGNVAILLHMSPPCTTFSLAGLQTHRKRDGSLSELAVMHDKLCSKMFCELYHCN
jgi:hypothetical protein